MNIMERTNELKRGKRTRIVTIEKRKVQENGKKIVCSDTE